MFSLLIKSYTHSRVSVTALIKRRDIKILLLLRCSVVCEFSTAIVSGCHHSSCA